MYYYEKKCSSKLGLREGASIWKDIPASWIGRLHITKMSVLPKVIYRFSAIPVKIPMTLIAEGEKSILKFIPNRKGPQMPKAVFERKNKVVKI